MEKTHLYVRDNWEDHLIQTISREALIERTTIKPRQSATLAKPVTANTPYILAPNVDGGLKVAAVSPVNLIAAKTVDAKSDVPNKTAIAQAVNAATVTAMNQNLKESKVTSNTSAQAGGLKLPNIWVMVAMIAAVVVMYFVAKRK